MAGPADLVLLDEPTNNLDGSGMQLLGEMLMRLDPHRAVLLVSHETELLQRHCTRILEVAG
jgi:zinc transport system ATP-binding protein